MSKSGFETSGDLERALARATLRRECITGRRAIVEIDTARGRWIARSVRAHGELVSIRTAATHVEAGDRVIQIAVTEIEDIEIRDARDDENSDDLGYLRR